MDNNNTDRRNEVFTERVKAGRRTYFLDIKQTRAGDHFLVITESKKHFNEESQKFYYEKHKVFLYKEDFDKFKESLDICLDKATELNEEAGIAQDDDMAGVGNDENDTSSSSSDVKFEDLGNEDDEENN